MIKASDGVSIITPTVGPAIITVFGLDVPVAAFALSVAGLLLARTIAPASRRRLTKWQERALTALLVLVLLVIVTGQFGGGPMRAGMAVVWGVGLGTSGLLVVEFFGQAIMNALKSAVGGKAE